MPLLELVAYNYKYAVGLIYPCTRCGKPYKSKKAMMTHLKFSCENHRSFFCNFCSAAYFYKHHLQRHMKQHQHKLAVETAFFQINIEVFSDVPCPKCGLVFKSAKTMKNHERYVCGKTKNFCCHHCDYKFFYRYHLKRHLKTHEK
ncbi:hypothetical protein BDFB_000069 [Asbolus verrucosus]|uniref:C2H2-type domain-containing protein n=1 Tax=Asbolus verrucosus TaxID=1661398 RepID=A0A482V7M7_ASBVE|nr:hypothetical protein BDFB_000069 [Asbolus verrucosus]